MASRGRGRAITKRNEFIPKKLICGFCKRNGESMAIYEEHTTKDSNGKVVCPQLRKHKCELCDATGDEAHTRSYCPFAELGRNDQFFKSQVFLASVPLNFHNMVSVKRTRVNSAGKLRKY